MSCTVRTQRAIETQNQASYIMGWTLLESQAETGIEKRTICKILRDSLHQPKITSKWVPYALTEVENGHGMQYVIY